MRALATIAVPIGIAVAVAACGLILPGMPGWCGTAATGGPGPFQPGVTFSPIPTPDPERLMCIAVENLSDVDFAIVERSDDGGSGAGLVAACSGMAVSQTQEDGWEVEVGPGNAHGLSGPAAARFDASRLHERGPYLISIVINPDRTASIEQVDALPPNPATSLC